MKKQRVLRSPIRIVYMNAGVETLSVMKFSSKCAAAEDDDSISTISLQDKPPEEIMRYLLQSLVKLWLNPLSVRFALSPPPPIFLSRRYAALCGVPEARRED